MHLLRPDFNCLLDASFVKLRFPVFVFLFFSQHSDFNSEIKLSARSADLPAAIDSALHRLVPALCAPLLNETLMMIISVLYR